MGFDAGTGKPSGDLIICTPLISQLRDLRYLSHLKSKSPFLKVELGRDLNPQHLSVNGEQDEAVPGLSPIPQITPSATPGSCLFCIKDCETS